MRERCIGFALVATLAACHRGLDVEPTSPSISPSRPLDTLSNDEVDQLCRWLREAGSSYVPSRQERCTLEALDRSTNRFECEAKRQTCQVEAGTVNVSCELQPDDFLGCDASYELFQRCARDRAANDELFFAGLSCSDPASADPYDSPSSCQALRSRCPGLGGAVNQPAEEDGGASPEAGDPYVDGGRRCNDGRDIDDAWWCDGTVDCSGGEDEQGCERPAVFRCSNGSRIEANLACNQTNDCADRSDELNCDDGYLCLDGQDIWDNRRCDGIRDCARGEDEESCN